MSQKTRNKVYSKAIGMWGSKAQLEMLQEEATELALATRRLIRKGETEENINDLASEIADVEILSEQVKLMFGSEMTKKIGYQKRFKISRLENRLKNKRFN